MRISGLANQRPLLNVNTINHTVNRRLGTEESGKKPVRDILALSPQGKSQSMISNLMNQKQRILDSRSELMASNAEKGGSMYDIKSQLDLYEEQLKNLDEQIAKESTKQMIPEEKDEKTAKPITEEELERDKINSLTQMASDVTTMEVVSSAKEKIDGQVRVLKAQVKTGNGNMDKKLEEIAELQSKSDDLLGDMGETIANAAEKVEENNKLSQEPKKEELEKTDEETMNSMDQEKK